MHNNSYEEGCHAPAPLQRVELCSNGHGWLNIDGSCAACLNIEAMDSESNNRPEDGRVCNCEDAPCCGHYQI
jgi:hypothetical protein